jgi:hypothetical protein
MKKTLLLLPLLLGAGGGAQAGDLFLITMNTSSIGGSSGYVDFSLSSGAGSDGSLTATVYGFTGGSYVAGTQSTDGTVSGAPITAGSPATTGSRRFWAQRRFRGIQLREHPLVLRFAERFRADQSGRRGHLTI